MIAVDALAVGAKVTVITSPSDPIELSLHPHAVISAVVGGSYLVEHPGVPHPRRFGPFTRDRLIEGWT